MRAGVALLGVALRLLVLLPPTAGLASLAAWWDLPNRLDLASPITQWDRLLDDAVFLSQPRRPPPMMAAMTALSHPVFRALFLVLLDFLAAVGLGQSVRGRLERDKSRHERENDLIQQWRTSNRPRLDSDGEVLPGSPVIEDASTLVDVLALNDLLAPDHLPDTVAALYWLSPLTVLACGAKSLSCLTVGLPGWTLVFAQQGNVLGAALLLALTAHWDGPCALAILLMPTWNCLRLALQFSRSKGLALEFTMSLVGCLAAVFYASFVANGYSWSYLQSSYLWVLSYAEPRPNPGAWWYLFLEVFPRFRTYFLVVLDSFVFHFVLPLSVHFASRPEFAAQMGLVIFLLFHPYCELNYLASVVVILFMHAEFAVALPFFASALAIAAFAVALQPIMLYSWLEAGTGNANYYYFQQLIALGALSILAANTILLAIRRDRALGRMEKQRKHQ